MVCIDQGVILLLYPFRNTLARNIDQSEERPNDGGVDMVGLGMDTYHGALQLSIGNPYMAAPYLLAEIIRCFVIFNR